MMLAIGYLAAVLMGIVLGVIGGGGSILTVPILVYLMGVDPVTATGYSLLIVGATAAFGVMRYFKAGQVEIKTVTLFALPSIIAVYITRLYLVPNIPDVLLTTPILITKENGIMVMLAGLMLASSFFMYKSALQSPTSQSYSPPSASSNLCLLIVLEGSVIGVLTGILGAGGGFMIIPALVLLLKMPMKAAVGASLFIIAAKSLIGFVGDLQSGIEIDWQIMPFFIAATVVGMGISTKIADKVEGSTLQKGFALFILVLAIIIIAKEFI